MAHRLLNCSCLPSALVGRVLNLSLLLVTVGTVLGQDYPTLGKALEDVNYSTFKFIIGNAGLKTILDDPTFNGIVLAVNNADFNQAFKDFPGANTQVNDAVANNAIANFHILPQPASAVQPSLNLTDGVALPTRLSAVGDTIKEGLVAGTLTTLTFRGSDDGPWYVGGSPPGATFRITDSKTAGNARVYYIRGLLVVPSKVVIVNTTRADTLSLYAALQRYSDNFSVMLALVDADPELKNLTQNSDLAVTMFSPVDTALRQHLQAINTTLAQFQGSKAAKSLIKDHIIAGRPFFVRQIPGPIAFENNMNAQPVTITSQPGLTADPTYGDPLAVVGVGGLGNNGGLFNLTVRDLRAGKSVLQGINGVLLPGVITAAPPPLNKSNAGSAGNGGSNAPTSSTDGGGGSSGGKTIGIAVGCAVGGIVLLSAAVFAVFYYRRRGAHAASLPTWKTASMGSPLKQSRHASHGSQRSVDGVLPTEPAQQVPAVGMDLPGVPKGLFTRHTAHEYKWTDYTPIPDVTVAVEAGVNDTELDAMLQPREGEEVDVELADRTSPVVKLTRHELHEQIQLLKTGLLGKGATALVFQCVWPSRFGPDALLAIKVLKDGNEADMTELESFAYEANVLSAVQHPNVVRMYGYCLEPPTVCLILELLPVSLKDLLYAAPNGAAFSTSQQPLGTHSLLAKYGMLDTADANGQHTTATQASAVVVSSSLAHGSSHNHLATLATSNGSHTRTPFATGSTLITPTTAMLRDLKLAPQSSSVMQTAARKLSMLQVLCISTDIAAGLAYLHDKPVSNGPIPAGAASPAKPAAENGDAEAIVKLPSVPSLASSQSLIKTQKVVHRDLKPANILLNSQGRAKISDFGLARQHNRTTIATMNLGAGTLPYMAPELLMSANAGPLQMTATNRVDIYSLAMIMWELCSGHMPWQGSGDAALMASVTQGRRPVLPDPPEEDPPIDSAVLIQPAGVDALAQFNTIIRACWQQRDMRRPKAAEVYAKLCQLMSDLGCPVEAGLPRSTFGELTQHSAAPSAAGTSGPSTQNS